MQFHNRWQDWYHWHRKWNLNLNNSSLISVSLPIKWIFQVRLIVINTKIRITRNYRRSKQLIWGLIKDRCLHLLDKSCHCDSISFLAVSCFSVFRFHLDNTFFFNKYLKASSVQSFKVFNSFRIIFSRIRFSLRWRLPGACHFRWHFASYFLQQVRISIVYVSVY